MLAFLYASSGSTDLTLAAIDWLKEGPGAALIYLALRVVLYFVILGTNVQLAMSFISLAFCIYWSFCSFARLAPYKLL